MKYSAIAFEGIAPAEGEDLFSAFDRKFSAAIKGNAETISVQLHPDMPCGGELLDWLEGWNVNCSVANKHMVIAPATPEQLECLELSHPDQNLNYVSSMAELEKLFPSQNEEPFPVDMEDPEIEAMDAVPENFNKQERFIAPPPPPPPPPPVAQATPAPVAEQPIETSDPFESYTDSQPLENVTDIVPEIQKTGSVVEISGEYTCLSCGYKRMWLKGDKVDDCENAECLNSQAGWQLTGDIF